MMKRWSGWLALLLVFSLLTGCSNASNYIKQTYPLVDVQGNGKDNAKVYAVANKDVPTVAKELAQKEAPKETSKENSDTMFLIYKEKIINIQKDPSKDKNSLVEIDSIQYAKDNYDSTFLKAYLTASILQSVMGGGWFTDSGKSDYRGYSSGPGSNKSGNGSTITSDDKKPTTSARSGTFSSKANTKSKSGASALSRKNDGSKPSFKKPTTSKKSGSFSSKKRK
jgi:hypothetical protein